MANHNKPTKINQPSAEIEPQTGTIEGGELGEGINEDSPGKPIGITDAAVLGDSIYFIKDNSILFEKRKDGQLLELFTFRPTESLISIEGFYLGNLVFLVLGRLYSINDKQQLELLAE